MGDVSSLNNANAVPEQSVIDALEDALELARTGDLRSVAITGDLVGNEWYSNAKFIDGIALLGHLYIAAQSVHQGMQR